MGSNTIQTLNRQCLSVCLSDTHQTSDRMMLTSLIFLHMTAASTAQSFLVSKISTLTSSIPGSGMDKPSVSFFGYSNGGTWSMELCSEEGCCHTGVLNTEDNNWELGQVDLFVGRSQIRDCYNFPVNSTLRLLLQHSGSNAGMLDWVRIHS